MSGPTNLYWVLRPEDERPIGPLLDQPDADEFPEGTRLFVVQGNSFDRTAPEAVDPVDEFLTTVYEAQDESLRGAFEQLVTQSRFSFEEIQDQFVLEILPDPEAAFNMNADPTSDSIEIIWRAPFTYRLRSKTLEERNSEKSPGGTSPETIPDQE